MFRAEYRQESVTLEPYDVFIPPDNTQAAIAGGFKIVSS